MAYSDQLPCFYFFLLGLFMWLNFCQFGGDTMYYWYPVILICITASILIVPLPILYFRSRQWLLYSMASIPILSAIVALTPLVAPMPGRVISRRVQRFLSRGHVLLSFVCDGCKSYNSNLDFDSLLSAYFLEYRTLLLSIL